MGSRRKSWRSLRPTSWKQMLYHPVGPPPAVFFIPDSGNGYVVRDSISRKLNHTKGSSQHPSWISLFLNASTVSSPSATSHCLYYHHLLFLSLEGCLIVIGNHLASTSVSWCLVHFHSSFAVLRITRQRYGISIPFFYHFALLAFLPCMCNAMLLIYIFSTPRFQLLAVHSMNRIFGPTCTNLTVVWGRMLHASGVIQLVKESFYWRFGYCSLKFTYRGII